jgi:hypothetical protein
VDFVVGEDQAGRRIFVHVPEGITRVTISHLVTPQNKVDVTSEVAGFSRFGGKFALEFVLPGSKAVQMLNLELPDVKFPGELWTATVRLNVLVQGTWSTGYLYTLCFWNGPKEKMAEAIKRYDGVLAESLKPKIADK